MLINGIKISHEEITRFCERWRIAELALFGSILREGFSRNSDVDILVTFAPGAQWTLFDHVDMQDELSAILEHRVDLVSRRGIERSRNPFRRTEILGTAQVIYGAP